MDEGHPGGKGPCPSRPVRLPQQKADTQIAKLSGGEKARLLFALMTREAPHILMLDEPTNHLDIDSREALIQAINGYEGP